MCFVMSHLRVFKAGKAAPPTERDPASNFPSSTELQFGPPPNLLMGAVTGLLGAGAGAVSLLLYFRFWQPEPYISQRWLVFLLAGAIFGYFMRLERPFIEEFSDGRNGEPDRL